MSSRVLDGTRATQRVSVISGKIADMICMKRKEKQSGTVFIEKKKNEMSLRAKDDEQMKNIAL